jgi:hypothetical protein
MALVLNDLSGYGSQPTTLFGLSEGLGNLAGV